MRALTAILFLGAGMIGACSNSSRSAGANADSAAGRPAASAPETSAMATAATPPVLKEGVHTVHGDTLELQLATGGVTRLVSHPGDGEQHIEYTFREFLPRAQYYVIDVHYYETVGEILIDAATGERSDLVDRPTISPSGNLGVAAARSLDVAEGANAIQLWRLVPHPAAVIWDTSTFGARAGGWGASVDGWSGDTAVLLTRHVRLDGPPDSTGSHPERREPMRLVRRGSAWMIDTVGH